jgi:class 3 adenylate cyclase
MKLFFSITAVTAAAYIAISQTDPGKTAVLNFIRPLEFQVRETLGLAPQMSDRVRILAFDDIALHRSGSPELSVGDWQRLIGAILRRNPKVVLIDKIFALPPEVDKTAPALDGPVFAAANTSDAEIPYRTGLDLSLPLYRWESYFPDQESLEGWPGRPARQAYGPAREMRPMFRAAGHINYDLYGRIRPLARVGQDAVLPHLSFLAADTISVRAGEIAVNGTAAPVNSAGLLQVNFPPVEAVYSRIMSLAPFVQSARKGSDNVFEDQIRSGDLVLILPLFYTGNTDFKETPVGVVPGGLVHAAVVNSIVSNNWLREVPGQPVIIVMLAAAGALLGLFLRSEIFFLAITGLSVVAAAAGLLLFSCFGLLIPWSFPLAAMFTAGILAFIYRAWQRDRLVTSLQSAFQGLVPEEVMAEYIASPDRILSQTEEVTATIMFIDIVGFSAFSSKESPGAVFHELKYYIGLCTRIIHEHGGIIDKTLGDGLLAFFGYDYSGRKRMHSHADSAIDSAVAIQQAMMREYEKIGANRLVLPLRIGINTARVYLGNLGTPPRIDFTIIGDGVNFAQRLESSCEPFQINIAQSTIDNSAKWSAGHPGIKTRTIEVKHFHEDFEVFELNPFFAQPEQLARVRQAFEINKEKIRRFVRHPVQDPDRITIETRSGPAKMIDYSRPGFSVETQRRLPQESTITVSIAGDQVFNDAMRSAGIAVLTAEVRWSRPSSDGFTSGLMLKDLDPGQLDLLFRAMRELLHAKEKSV